MTAIPEHLQPAMDALAEQLRQDKVVTLYPRPACLVHGCTKERDHMGPCSTAADADALRQRYPNFPPELTQEERAYRRGCLQAVQFLKSHLERSMTAWQTPGLAVLMNYIADWEQALQAGRVSPDPAYLGRYLDEVKQRLAVKAAEGNK